MIYKHLSVDLTNKNCTNFLKSLAISNGTITSSFSNGRTAKCTMFFALGFHDQKDVDLFQSFGWQTYNPPKLHVN